MATPSSSSASPSSAAAALVPAHPHVAIDGRTTKIDAVFRFCIDGTPTGPGDVLLVHGPAGVGKTNVVLTALEAAREDLTAEQTRQTYLLAPTLSALILALDGTPVNDNDVFEKDDVDDSHAAGGAAAALKRLQARMHTTGEACEKLAKVKPSKGKWIVVLDAVDADDKPLAAVVRWLVDDARARVIIVARRKNGDYVQQLEVPVPTTREATSMMVKAWALAKSHGKDDLATPSSLALTGMQKIALALDCLPLACVQAGRRLARATFLSPEDMLEIVKDDLVDRTEEDVNGHLNVGETFHRQLRAVPETLHRPVLETLCLLDAGHGVDERIINSWLPLFMFSRMRNVTVSQPPQSARRLLDYLTERALVTVKVRADQRIYTVLPVVSAMCKRELHDGIKDDSNGYATDIMDAAILALRDDKFPPTAVARHVLVLPASPVPISHAVVPSLAHLVEKIEKVVTASAVAEVHGMIAKTADPVKLPNVFADSATKFAAALTLRGRKTEARGWLERAARAVETHGHGSGHEARSSAIRIELQNLGGEPVVTEAEAVSSAAGGDPALARIYASLRKRRAAEALVATQHALEALEGSSSDDDTVHRALLLEARAMVHLSLGHLYESRIDISTAVFILRHHHAGSDTPQSLATALTHQAGILQRLGEYEAALAAQKEAVAVLEKLYPDGNSALARALNNLGCLEMHAGHSRDGVAVLTRALEMRRKTLVASSSEVGNALANLGMAMAFTTDAASAISKLNEGLAVLAKSMPTSSAELVGLRRAIAKLTAGERLSGTDLRMAAAASAKDLLDAAPKSDLSEPMHDLWAQSLALYAHLH